MPAPMTETDVRRCTDVDLLWTSFLDARQQGDDTRAEVLRARMAELQEQRAIEEMDDDQLLAQIAHIEQHREQEGAIDLDVSPPGPVARLSVLLSEAARRHL